MFPDPIQLPFIDAAQRPPVLMLVVTVIFGFWIGARWLESLEGFNRWKSRLVFAVLAVAIFYGGRAHFLLNNWDFLAGRRNPWAPWPGGLHAGGAMAALAVATPLVLLAFRMPIGRFVDGISPTVGVGIALARVGCLLQGCCFGTVCHLPWAITFPRKAYVWSYHKGLGHVTDEALRSAPVHPLQIYFILAALLLTAVALWLYPRRRYPGQVALVVLLVYGISAAVLEFFRADYYPRKYWGPLPQLEWTALGITALALAALGSAEWLHRRRAARAGAPVEQGA